jgi:hypothetical protein
MPPRKPQKFTDKETGEIVEFKPVRPEMLISPHIRIREGLWEHIEMGRMTPHDMAVYLTLQRHAKWGTGVCFTNAAAIAYNWGCGELKVSTVQKCMRRMREEGFINYPEGGLGRGRPFPVLIDKYQPQVGILTGWQLNAQVTTDFNDPVYDYVSSTSYGAVYGAVADASAVRMSIVCGAGHGAYVVRDVVRSNTTSIQALTTSQTGQRGQTCKSSVAPASQTNGNPDGTDSDGKVYLMPCGCWYDPEEPDNCPYARCPHKETGQTFTVEDDRELD